MLKRQNTVSYNYIIMYIMLVRQFVNLSNFYVTILGDVQVGTYGNHKQVIEGYEGGGGLGVWGFCWGHEVGQYKLI